MRPSEQSAKDGAGERVSRTQKKKDALAAQKLGEQLLTLTDEQLEKLDIPDSLQSAVEQARGIKKHGARRRQLQYIGTIMRNLDTQLLKAELEAIFDQGHEHIRRFKQVEHWRDRLAAGGKEQVDELITECPQMDRQTLMKMVQNCQRTGSGSEARKAGRALFRYIRQFLID